jgi:hypothetical protein
VGVGSRLHVLVVAPECDERLAIDVELLLDVVLAGEGHVLRTLLRGVPAIGRHRYKTVPR